MRRIALCKVAGNGNKCSYRRSGYYRHGSGRTADLAGSTTKYGSKVIQCKWRHTNLQRHPCPTVRQKQGQAASATTPAVNPPKISPVVNLNFFISTSFLVTNNRSFFLNYLIHIPLICMLQASIEPSIEYKTFELQTFSEHCESNHNSPLGII